MPRQLCPGAKLRAPYLVEHSAPDHVTTCICCKPGFSFVHSLAQNENNDIRTDPLSNRLCPLNYKFAEVFIIRSKWLVIFSICPLVLFTTAGCHLSWHFSENSENLANSFFTTQYHVIVGRKPCVNSRHTDTIRWPHSSEEECSIFVLEG